LSQEAFPIDEFYSRIGIKPGTGATLERLETLQRAFIYAVPFENFDIMLGREIKLSMPALIDKIIRKKRGGYCFETNALFLAALQMEGFQCRSVLGRVHVRGESTGRGHQAVLVNVSNTDFLVDVGFGGGCPRVPMPLNDTSTKKHDGTPFRLGDSELGTMLQSQTLEGEWQDLYSFDLCPVIQKDIEVANFYTSKHHNSFLANTRVAVKSHPHGELRLMNYQSVSVQSGNVQSETLPDSEEYLVTLNNSYGIDLDASYSDLAPLETP